MDFEINDRVTYNLDLEDEYIIVATKEEPRIISGTDEILEVPRNYDYYISRAEFKNKFERFLAVYSNQIKLI